MYRVIAIINVYNGDTQEGGNMFPSTEADSILQKKIPLKAFFQSEPQFFCPIATDWLVGSSLPPLVRLVMEAILDGCKYRCALRLWLGLWCVLGTKSLKITALCNQV